MKLSRRHLAEVIASRTLGLPEKKLAHEIAAYLLEIRHTAYLEPLLRDIMLYRQEHGMVEATVISAHPLDEAALADVRAILQTALPNSKKIMLDSKLDSDVVGGVRIDLPRQQLDLTVRAKLNRFKRLTTEGVN